jgi:osmotically-inducible protein OsmY
MKPDSLLQAEVLEELRADVRVTAHDIAVSVRDGVVSLGGEVDSLSKKVAAVRAAERVHGARALVDAIRVHLPVDQRRSDIDIAHAAVNALIWDTEVPDKTIKLRVQDGWIWLVGEAEWQFQRVAAQRAVENIAGVKGIRNVVRLKSRGPSLNVRDDIERALSRNATLASRAIGVAVVGSKVRLTGTVSSWSERIAAENTVWSARGVTEVENELSIAA